MPSPVGHVLGAVAAGWTVAPRRPQWRETVLFGVLGLAPDLDLLAGTHSTYTHSLGAAATVGLLAALVRPSARRHWSAAGRLAFGLACAAAYSSHILLDWLGTDRTAPIGVMALWPWSWAFYQSELHLFHGISRRYWLPSFWATNLVAALREVLILGPLALVIGLLRARRSPAPQG